MMDLYCAIKLFKKLFKFENNKIYENFHKLNIKKKYKLNINIKKKYYNEIL